LTKTPGKKDLEGGRMGEAWNAWNRENERSFEKKGSWGVRIRWGREGRAAYVLWIKKTNRF